MDPNNHAAKLRGADRKGNQCEAGSHSLPAARRRDVSGHVRLDSRGAVRPLAVAKERFNEDWQELAYPTRVITAPHSLNLIPVRNPSAVGCGRDNPSWRIS